MRILIVEDDEVIAEQTAKSLKEDHHHVDVAFDGEAGWDLLAENSFGLIILDIMMPKLDGISLCKRARDFGVSSSIIMLTARDEVEKVVEGLDAGADDYLTKPFDVRELKARVRALARRDANEKNQHIHIGDLVINTKAHTVERDGKPIQLTQREYTLLEAFARYRDQILTRDAILERVWNNDRSLANTVNFHVSSLRKKIDHGFEQKLIHTAHGLGYVLRTPD